MNISFNVSTLMSIKSYLQGFASIFLMVLILVWVFLRTQSTSPLHLLVLKIFRIKVGQEATEVKSFVDNLSTLMIFRFLTQLNVSTKQQADELINWANEKKVSLIQLQKCGKYFDLEQRKILTQLLPSKAGKVIGRVIALLLLLAVLICAWLGAYNKSIVTFNQSGTWVSLDQSTAYQINPFQNNPLLAKAGPDCINTYVNVGDQRQPLTADELKELCQSFNDPETAKFIDNTVLQQRVFAAYYGILLLIVVIAFFFIPMN
jgi:hypothetical protein